ncbi:Acetyltransferase (GNAT) family protein [Nocardioides terrae]|uniref:Acetyltransferase (GNAT) family protein n=1 Tax=Nocardioides terrae TaxID=574651 RepID=A0A1I1JIR0_9ACTN|nr:GNAT family N-acetyltransferase [Nocardioides terrae]SFC48061.1 Acetyltransferase (GNAT) family protein [Nocardioides terrae]
MTNGQAHRTVHLREAGPGDRDACYDICLRTGDSGGDASGLYADPTLVGSVYAGPYLTVGPGLGYVAVDGGGVAGYVLGTADTRAFEAACESDWWPALRARQPDPGPHPLTPDDRMRRLVHRPPTVPDAVVRAHPAHLHIDLLPHLQGTGTGRALMERILARFAAEGASGVHLGVARANERAVGFYRHLGFTVLTEDDDGLVLGQRLRRL